MFRVFPPLVAGIATLSIGFHSFTAFNAPSAEIDTSNWGEADLVQPIEPTLLEEVKVSKDEALVAIERSQMFAQFAPEPNLETIDRIETGSLSGTQQTQGNSEVIKRIGVFLEELDTNSVSQHAKKL